MATDSMRSVVSESSATTQIDGKDETHMVDGVGVTAPALNEAPDPSNGSLLATVESIRTEVTRLADSFEARFRYDAAKEMAFDRLYEDLDFARVASEFQRMRPLYFDLILLFDRLDKAAEAPHHQLSPSFDSHGLLVSLREELLEILARRGVELISPSPQLFDATLQRVIGIEAAGDQDEENSIVTVVRKGFRHEHHLVRAEEVILRKRLRPTSTAGSRPSIGEDRD